MVIGNEFVFDNVEQARDYILQMEKSNLANMVQRKNPLVVCDKIFIPGDDGTMKQTLKNVRFDSRYRWVLSQVLLILLIIKKDIC